jgi:AcrR family transcriptional regulator
MQEHSSRCGRGLSESPAAEYPVPKDQRPKQERAQATQVAIIRAAATVFGQRGYARTTLDAVALEAGVTKGALYFHFDSKHDLANAVIAEELRLTAEVAQQTLDAGYPGIETIVRLNRNLADQIVNDVVVAAGVKLVTEELVAQLNIESPYAAWTELYRGLFARAVAEGELLPELDVERLTRFVIGAFTGVQMVSASLSDRTDLFERVREMWEILLPAISAPHCLEACKSLPALIRP